MSRVKTLDRCGSTKPQAPTDKKIYQCGRRAGHKGECSSGKYFKWKRGS